MEREFLEIALRDDKSVLGICRGIQFINAVLGGTLYLCGKEVIDGSYIKNANSCSMCKRMIINAGISKVIIRDSKTDFRVIDVESEWINNDESLEGLFNY